MWYPRLHAGESWWVKENISALGKFPFYPSLGGKKQMTNFTLPSSYISDPHNSSLSSTTMCCLQDRTHYEHKCPIPSRLLKAAIEKQFWLISYMTSFLLTSYSWFTWKAVGIQRWTGNREHVDLRRKRWKGALWCLEKIMTPICNETYLNLPGCVEILPGAKSHHGLLKKITCLSCNIYSGYKTV